MARKAVVINWKCHEDEPTKTIIASNQSRGDAKSKTGDIYTENLIQSELI